MVLLQPDDRILVCNRDSRSGRNWPVELARKLGIASRFPRTARHTTFSDGEYKIKFLNPDAKEELSLIGKGLEGKTVYILIHYNS